MEATMGRIVHVMWEDGVTSPAIVTRTNADTVNSPASTIGTASTIGSVMMPDRWGRVPVMLMGAGHVDLMVFGLTQTYPLYDVPFSETPQPGHWSWPPHIRAEVV